MISPVSSINQSTSSEREYGLTMGVLLQQQGKLTRQDIDRILMAQSHSSLRFGEAALRLGLLKASDVQQVLSQQFSYPYLVEGRGSYPPELVSAYRPFSDQSEVLRSIRSQLMLNWFSNGKKTLAFAGVHSGDGTSFLAANMAIVFSQLGMSVLLVDANLRNASQHEIFDLPWRRGLSDMLAWNCGMEAIVDIKHFPNLSLLSAGTCPPNPQELLSRPVMAEIHDTLSRRFSIILYDLPPYTNGLDSLAVAKLTGGIVLVARRNHTPLTELKAFGKQLRNCGVELVGSIMGQFQ